MIQIPTSPLSFAPICQYRLWGGRCLANWLEKPLPGVGPIGEAWLLSDRSENPSRVSIGPFKGQTLAQLIAAFPDAILGKLASRFNRFPLLIKYLDVSMMLSVQVHPSDAHAGLIPRGETGKTEGWVVLEARAGSRMYAGLKPGSTPAMLRALSQANVDDVLPSFTPTAGQSIFVEAGDVHAFGNGVVVLEVQQNSDVTFRLYDWDRLDPNTGLARQLHVEQALECINFTQGAIMPTVPVVEANQGFLRERLFDCPQFQLRRNCGSVPFNIDTLDTPTVLVCIAGSGSLGQGAIDYPMAKGGLMFLPAAAKTCRFHPDGETTLLEIVVPSDWRKSVVPGTMR